MQRFPLLRFPLPFLLLFIFLLGTALQAQNAAPAILHEAAHCLVTGVAAGGGGHNWLDAETLQSKELNLGYRLDAKTLLGDEYLYAIVYTGPDRKEGKIFDIRIKQHHAYSVENSARFVSSAKGVEFPEPPLGGQWTQNQYASAIEEMGRHKWYTATMKSLMKPNSHVQCEAAAEQN